MIIAERKLPGGVSRSSLGGGNSAKGGSRGRKENPPNAVLSFEGHGEVNDVKGATGCFGRGELVRIATEGTKI